jgi:subtilase family serine protease
VGPYDFATIYNVLPLWNAGIDGTGQTIAIVARSNINIQDVRDFRNLFGLPAKDPKIIVNGPDPGITSVDEETEADLDVQWSGAVAKNATIDFVVSATTNSTNGVDLSAAYIVENNLAPIMSVSFGSCEFFLGTGGNQFYSQLWQRAAAQGITVFVAAGDQGSASCDVGPAAQFGLAVSGLASTPYNVAVGGTDFDDFNIWQEFWNANNNSTTQASAKGYIPETTWNDSCTNGLLASLKFSADPETNCNNPALQPDFLVVSGGGGGASSCTVSDFNPNTGAGASQKQCTYECSVKQRAVQKDVL